MFGQLLHRGHIGMVLERIKLPTTYIRGGNLTKTSFLSSISYASTNERGDACSLAGFPVVADVKSMPTRAFDCDNETLFFLAHLGEFDALRERMLREIMFVDKLSSKEAEEKLIEITAVYDRGNWITLLPFRLGSMAGLAASTLCVPLVYHKALVVWFGYEVAKIPGFPLYHHISSSLLASKFAWLWMDPLTSVLSFMFLGLQLMKIMLRKFSRFRPIAGYKDIILMKRTAVLFQEYPQYDKNILSHYFAATANEK
eukprot:snap_masked-scaffold_5-processed-gene-16.53-mRNA-1 protein AED:0.00 eAED:0.00 QI:106/1/1/1/0.66/0.5/4/954/255